LAEGLTRTEVEEVLAATPRLAGISETVTELHRRGCRVAILTHNPSYVCRWYVREFGFDDAEGADDTPLLDDRVPSAPAVRADKSTGLARLLLRARVEPMAAVHLGDGWPDALIFPHVGGGIAVNSTMPEVERAADVALHLSDLRPLLGVLEALRPRTPVKTAHRSSGRL
jgi:phosphoserine phosphatase